SKEEPREAMRRCPLPQGAADLHPHGRRRGSHSRRRFPEAAWPGRLQRAADLRAAQAPRLLSRVRSWAQGPVRPAVAGPATVGAGGTASTADAVAAGGTRRRVAELAVVDVAAHARSLGIAARGLALGIAAARGAHRLLGVDTVSCGCVTGADRLPAFEVGRLVAGDRGSHAGPGTVTVVGLGTEIVVRAVCRLGLRSVEAGAVHARTDLRVALAG